MVCTYAWQAKIPRATGKRRVSLHVTLGKGMREFDYDAPWKSLNDAMKHAGLIVDDSVGTGSVSCNSVFILHLGRFLDQEELMEREAMVQNP